MMTRILWLAALSLLLTTACADSLPSEGTDIRPDVGFADIPVTNDPGGPEPDTNVGTADTKKELPTAGVGLCTGTPGDKAIQSPCAEHCDCATGYCYDENYLGSGFKFCSVDCSTGAECSGLKHPTETGIQKYGCLNMNSLKDDYNLTKTAICVLRCSDVAECQGYSGQYDQCGNFSANATMWEGHTIAAFSTCLISSEISKDEP